MTVKVAGIEGIFSKEDFERFVSEPVKKKYPNIELQYTPLKYSVDRYELMLASGEKPDILFETNLLFDDAIRAKLVENMEPHLKAYGIDLGKIEPVALEAFKIAGREGHLSAVPFSRHFNALYYNKTIFDKFGVAYPKNGILWDEAIELARKLTRTEDGRFYRGLDPEIPFRTASSLGLAIVDAKTEKSLVMDQGWNQVFQMYKTIYEIPGYKENYSGPGNWGQFVAGNTAMYAGLNLLPQIETRAPNLNWDMATYPSFKEAPGTGMEFDGFGIIVTPLSEQKAAAYKVVEVMLSVEAQSQLSRTGRTPIVTDPNIRNEFGKSIPIVQGKQIQSVFQSTFARPHVSTPYDSKARTAMNNKTTEILKGTKDINTALRELDEEITRFIGEMKN